MKIEVSKLDAARRQLETSIRLFFYDCDPVSVHTLASAALNVLIDLSRGAGEDKKSIRDEVLEWVVEDKRKWFIDKMRETENFMKHADRDPDSMHSFDPRFSSLHLIDGVRTYWKLSGEKTLLMDAFFLWFILEHPRVFVVPGEYRETMAMGPNLMEGIPKSMFLESVIPLLMRRGYST